MFIYVAHPIDNANLYNWQMLAKVREKLRNLLGEKYSDYVLYEPAAAFSVGKEAQPTTKINVVNNQALKQADLLLAIVPSNARTWGTIDEIRHALTLGTPVVVYTDSQEKLGWAAQYEPEDDITFIESRYGAMQTNESVRAVVAILVEVITRVATRAEESKPRPGYDVSVLPVSWERENEPTRYPTKAHSDDAGFDLYVSKDTVIPPHAFADVPTNTRVALPVGTWGYLTGRSSTMRNRGLLVNPGVIDRGYTGELYSGVWNLTNESVELKEGDRVAQLIVINNPTEGTIVIPVDKEKFDSYDTSRGTDGFGSSGQ